MSNGEGGKGGNLSAESWPPAFGGARSPRRSPAGEGRPGGEPAVEALVARASAAATGP